MSRLFVAVWPTPAVSDAVAAALAGQMDGWHPVERENWHITLRFVGNADDGEVADALANAAFPRATATLGPSAVVLGGAHLVIPVDGLDECAATACDATAGLGVPPERRPFFGHLTVGRAARGGFRDAAPIAVGIALSARFEVREVALVSSETTRGRSGPTYRTLRRWPTR